MKKFLVLLFVFIFIDVIIMTICVYLYKDYNDNYELLLSKLDGYGYEDVLDKKMLEMDEIINDIESDIGYEFNDEVTFEDIKRKLDNNYNELLATNGELVKKKGQLTNQNNNLKKLYNGILEEERKKSSFLINNVPKVNQYSLGYPTGCESAALTNLLNFWGVSVSIKDVVKVLPKGSLPYYEGNIKYGGNPYIEFVGHPNSYSSYGVYEKPIKDVANQFKSGIIDGTGMSLSSVLDIVREGRPVIVWVSMNMAVPYISTSWIYKPTGEKISWMANEHALVVVGYNNSQVIASDSLTGSFKYFDKRVFESRYNTYGKRSLYY